MPSSRQIAEAAGVTQRTLFNHFEHLGQLFAAAQEDQIHRVMDELPTVGPEGPLADRLDRYVTGMCRVLEENAPIYWIAYTRASDVPDVAEMIRVSRQQGRAMVERAFSPSSTRSTPTPAAPSWMPSSCRCLRSHGTFAVISRGSPSPRPRPRCGSSAPGCSRPRRLLDRNQRAWHSGHQVVERASIVFRRSGVPHRSHGSPARP